MRALKGNLATPFKGGSGKKQELTRRLFSQVFWFETCHLGQAGQHARANLVAIMKSEDDIWPPSPLQDFMRASDSV